MIVTNDYVLLEKKDNVVIAIRSLAKGEKLNIISNKIKTQEIIPQWHKVSIKDIDIGNHIIKYGRVIGKALVNIKSGQHVHNHNIETLQR